jgi:hypothetical protein
MSVGHVSLAVGSIVGVVPLLPPEPLALALDPEPRDPPLEPELP